MNKKGLTLIEIIISITILGMIATSFIGGFSNYFSWMTYTKSKITIDSFDSQKKMEFNISEIKNTLIGNSVPNSSLYKTTKEDIMLFKDKFPPSTFTIRKNAKVYITETPISSNSKMVAWVGETRMLPLPVPVLNEPSLNFIRNSLISTNIYDKYEYHNSNALTMYGATSIKENPGNSFYRNKSEWYVSEPGFLIPMPPIEEINIDYDLGRLYPSFPNNFSPVPIYSPLLSTTNNSTLPNNILNKFQERHIIYTITPYSKDLKRGILKASFPLYVTGPTNPDDLILHLDASKIRYRDVNLVEEDLSTGYNVKLWKNMRISPVNNNNYNAEQLNSSKRPVLVSNIPYGNADYLGPEIPFQGEGTYEPRIWGRALGNKMPHNTSSLTINNLLINSNQNHNLFIILRKVQNPAGPIVGGASLLKGISNDKPWSLDWESESLMTLKAPYLPNDLVGVIESPYYTSGYNFETGEWSLLKLQFVDGKISFDVYNLTKGKENTYNEANSSTKVDFHQISTNGIELNLNGIEVAEILLYGNISETNLLKTTEYLKGKYNN